MRRESKEEIFNALHIKHGSWSQNNPVMVSQLATTRCGKSWHSLQSGLNDTEDLVDLWVYVPLEILLVCECTYRWRPCWSVSVCTVGDLVGLWVAHDLLWLAEDDKVACDADAHAVRVRLWLRGTLVIIDRLLNDHTERRPIHAVRLGRMRLQNTWNLVKPTTGRIHTFL